MTTAAGNTSPGSPSDGTGCESTRKQRMAGHATTHTSGSTQSERTVEALHDGAQHRESGRLGNVAIARRGPAGPAHASPTTWRFSVRNSNQRHLHRKVPRGGRRGLLSSFEGVLFYGLVGRTASLRDLGEWLPTAGTPNSIPP